MRKQELAELEYLFGETVWLGGAIGMQCKQQAIGRKLLHCERVHMMMLMVMFETN